VSEPPWLDAGEARVWRAYLGLRRDVDGAVEHHLAGLGLSTADYAVLVPLAEAPDGGLRPRDLGQQVGWDRSRLSHHLRRMQERGLVRRAQCPTDRRGTMVELTPTGRGALETAAPGHVQNVRRHFIDLISPDEGDVLVAIAERVHQELDQDSHRP
jgi:DNA-binding MarR family transcriptional regulator